MLGHLHIYTNFIYPSQQPFQLNIITPIYRWGKLRLRKFFRNIFRRCTQLLKRIHLHSVNKRGLNEEPYKRSGKGTTRLPPDLVLPARLGSEVPGEPGLSRCPGQGFLPPVQVRDLLLWVSKDLSLSAEAGLGLSPTAEEGKEVGLWPCAQLVQSSRPWDRTSWVGRCPGELPLGHQQLPRHAQQG